jgi:formiminotetrahydrofolate cyclodeaminase
MLAELSIKDFLEKVASDTPLPAGGSVIALTAALAASLSEMAARLTIGKKGYESVYSEMASAANKAAEYRELLIQYIDNDVDAYSEVMNAYQLPKTTEEDKEYRKQAVENGLKKAAMVPADVARYASEVMNLAQRIAQKGNRHCAPDAEVGAMIAKAAVLAALHNVDINLKSITDSAFAAELSEQAKNIKKTIES